MRTRKVLYCRQVLLLLLFAVKALLYPPTVQLWTRSTGTKRVVYVQCSVYVAVCSPADVYCEVGGLTY